MNNHNEPFTAVDVIRWVWLARTAAQRGDVEADRRWQAKADAWLERTRAGPRGVAHTTTALPFTE